MDRSLLLFFSFSSCLSGRRNGPVNTHGAERGAAVNPADRRRQDCSRVTLRDDI